jgi:hypothetical protein
MLSIIIHYVLEYLFIGATLSIPLILSVERCEYCTKNTTKEVLLTIFFWPWLWVLLIKMFIEFLFKDLW